MSVWLLEHPYLLDDRDTLGTLLEVVELGISGSKSQVGRPDGSSDPVDKLGWENTTCLESVNVGPCDGV